MDSSHIEVPIDVVAYFPAWANLSSRIQMMLTNTHTSIAIFPDKISGLTSQWTEIKSTFRIKNI